MNYEIEHRETATDRVIQRYVSDALTLAEAILEAHNEIKPEPVEEYLVTRPCKVH